jgi:hypothetical protein
LRLDLISRIAITPSFTPVQAKIPASIKAPQLLMVAKGFHGIRRHQITAHVAEIADNANRTTMLSAIHARSPAVAAPGACVFSQSLTAARTLSLTSRYRLLNHEIIGKNGGKAALKISAVRA